MQMTNTLLNVILTILSNNSGDTSHIPMTGWNDTANLVVVRYSMSMKYQDEKN